MKISELVKNAPTLSFEVFPPKDSQPLPPLDETLKRLSALNPDFISVTYGAAGTNVGRTMEVCELIKKYNMTSLQHFTCVGNTAEEIDDFTKRYAALGIKNLLLLRGDLTEEKKPIDFVYASDLIKYFSRKHGDFDIGAAAYPETHIEAESAKADIRSLKLKQEYGAKFLITQLCFDPANLERWLKKARGMGVKIPVIAGVMPALKKESVIKMCLSNGCSIPKKLARIIGKYADAPEDFKKAGIEFTASLIGEINKIGVAGVHIYTLNNYREVEQIAKATAAN
jgi:methylenetetrahydrofolate reductase (NADPH)